MRVDGLIVVCFLLFLVACSPVMSPPDPAEALTDDFGLTSEELNEWSTFLEQRRDFRRQLRQVADRREEVARAAAATEILLREYGDLVSDVEALRLWRGLADRATRETYVREMLRPRVVVEAAEVREIFDTHRDGYRKARGAKVLEIFLWAPHDLSDLRAEKKAFLEEFRAKVETPEAFRTAATEYSDATSAFRGGSIGTVLEDQVPGVLQQVLFTGVGGLTDIVESPEGLFLFWVVRRVDARENTFDDVADGIEAKLRQQRMRALVTADSEALRRRHDFGLFSDAPPATADEAVLRLDGTVFSLRDLGLDSWNLRVVENRGMAMLWAGVLRERGIEIGRPSAVEYDWLLSRRILARLVDRALDTATEHEEISSGNDGASTRAVERWTFDLLTIDGARSSDELFAVFRTQYDLAEIADLATLQEALERSHGLQSTIRSFEDVLASSVGGLGPEIHSTIKHRLHEGGVSKPMHLSKSEQVVVIMLKVRRIDEQAGLAGGASAKEKRSRRRAEERIVDDLLRAHGFHLISSEAPLR